MDCSLIITAMAYQIDKEQGRIYPAKWVKSPNFDARPEGVEPNLIVVHGISLPPNQFGGDGVVQLFTNNLDPNAHPYYREIAHLKVSSHLFIRRDGEVVQFVAFHQRAWHAGVSRWLGRERCNDFSIGIELEGADHLPYRAEQYGMLAEVIQALQQVYPIEQNAVVGHCDIAPERKTDPGEMFNWKALKRLMQRKAV